MLNKIPQIHFSKGKEFLAKLLGVSIVLTSIAGLYFLADGMYGDRMLRNALSDNIADATVIIVAQRISTVMNADQIIVLNQGEIADIGTHEELMARCEPYIEIARSQLSSAELRVGGSDG
jgi:hypothetical protein